MNTYVYQREQLESIADTINQRFFPERLSKLSPLDCYALLEKLGLNVEWKYISPGDDISGMIFFESSYWYVWPNGYFLPEQKPIKEHFAQQTVVINQILLDENNKEKERFVVGHEISHWLKDRQYFADHPKKIVEMCSKDNDSKSDWNNSMSETDIIERQTNYLNAALFLPRKVARDRFFKLLRYKNTPIEPIEYKTFMKGAIAKISKEVGLNFNPVRYRLYDLNILKR